MSIRSILNSNYDLVFGGNVGVEGDTTINGDLTIGGSITGTHSQGQDANNTWTGTNTYANYYPTSEVDGTDPTSATRNSQFNSYLVNNDATQQANTWTSTNQFTEPVESSTQPSNGDHPVSKSYVDSGLSTLTVDLLNANNNWTGNNTFTQLLVDDPVANQELTTKQYALQEIANTAQAPAQVQTSQTITGFTNVFLPANTKMMCVSLQGAGGGGQTLNTQAKYYYGTSGGSGGFGMIYCLVDPSIGSSFNIVGGSGGSGSIGNPETGFYIPPTNGDPTSFTAYYDPTGSASYRGQTQTLISGTGGGANQDVNDTADLEANPEIMSPPPDLTGYGNNPSVLTALYNGAKGRANTGKQTVLNLGIDNFGAGGQGKRSTTGVSGGDGQRAGISILTVQ